MFEKGTITFTIMSYLDARWTPKQGKVAFWSHASEWI